MSSVRAQAIHPSTTPGTVPSSSFAAISAGRVDLNAVGKGSLEYSSTGYKELHKSDFKRAWTRSVVGVIASQTLDVVSSYGMLERNPLLASADGGFGPKAASIKFGYTAAAVGVEYLIVKKYPSAARILSKLNWSSAVLTSGLAVHNFAIK
jgi:hypothetical protein